MDLFKPPADGAFRELFPLAVLGVRVESGFRGVDVPLAPLLRAAD